MTASWLQPSHVRRVLVGMIVILASFGAADVASAHTDFDSSIPADGEVVEGPLSEVVVNFTNPAQAAGDGFELLDPTGVVRTPSSIDETDGTSFVLAFDPPLPAGTYGVRWSVQAGDAHPIDGSFQFDVTEPAATVASTTPPPSTTVPVAAATTDTSATTAPTAVAADDGSLDEFLAGESTGDDTTSAGRFGRGITMLATIFGVGAAAALIWMIRGRRDELHSQLAWIRVAGVAIAAGGMVELAALQSAQGIDVGDLTTTKAGVATILKIAGGVAVWFGFHERAGRIVAPPHSLSAAVATDLHPTPTDAVSGHDAGHRWTPSYSAAAGLAGYGLVLASFWFDGHTVSEGPWIIHSFVNAVHLGAAAVWGGGVFAMTTVAWRRRRRSDDVGLAAMVVRFSSLATVSLAAVIVAGIAMTALIIDSPGDLVGTSWGRILIAKTTAVAVAAGIGAYNHYKLRPALERWPDDPQLARELRASLSIESVVFVVVIVLTAVLVAAAT